MQDNHDGVLLEDMSSKLQGIAEAMGVMNQLLMTMAPQVALIPNIAADVETIKLVQAAQARELKSQSAYLVSQGMPTRV